MVLRAPLSCNAPSCWALCVPGTQYCKRHQRKPDAQQYRRYRPEYRKLYQTAAWAQIRAHILARDPICKICDREGSYVTDHIKDHKGDPKLFFDPENCQGVCKGCHDKKTGEDQARNPNAPVPTGAPGKQFVSCSDPDAVDRALARRDTP